MSQIELARRLTVRTEKMEVSVNSAGLKRIALTFRMKSGGG